MVQGQFLKGNLYCATVYKRRPAEGKGPLATNISYNGLPIAHFPLLILLYSIDIAPTACAVLYKRCGPVDGDDCGELQGPFMNSCPWYSRKLDITHVHGASCLLSHKSPLLDTLWISFAVSNLIHKCIYLYLPPDAVVMGLKPAKRVT